MSIYRITGTFQMGSMNTKFTKEIIADTEDQAREHTLSIIGSKHRTKRALINLANIEEILPEEVIDPIVKHQVEAMAHGNE
jgi:large subunit ribosomal protein LX